jgi:hypothetical protein
LYVEVLIEIHEYQAKQLLENFGVTIPAGGLAYSPEQAKLYYAKAPRKSGMQRKSIYFARMALVSYPPRLNSENPTQNC